MGMTGVSFIMCALNNPCANKKILHFKAKASIGVKVC